MPEPAIRRLHLELTNRCNSVCATCVRTTHPDSDRDMSVDEVDRITRALPQLESVALQVNGEPLVYAALCDVISLLKARQIRVELNTNAIVLESRVGARLIESGLDQLNISIDGMRAETYQQLRGVDALERVMSNTRAFMQQRGPDRVGPRVSLWMTISQHNIEELTDLVAFAGEIAAEEVYVQRLVFYGEGFARSEDSLHQCLSPEQEALLQRVSVQAEHLGVALRASGGYTLVDMLSTRAEEPWRECRRPSESAVVMANGDVVPCCISTFVGARNDIRMGNVFDSGWDELWQGQAYENMRKSLKSGPGPRFCRGCGVKWSL